MPTGFIIDTNAWISHFYFVAALLNLLNVAPRLGQRLIIPKTVLLELDGLKNRADIGHLASRARQFIDLYINLKDPLILVEEMRRDTDPWLKGDDAILNCALWYLKRYQLVLITDDVEFSLRAREKGIVAVACRYYTVPGIIKRYFERPSPENKPTHAVSAASPKPLEVMELSPEPSKVADPAPRAAQPSAAPEPTPAPVIEISRESSHKSLLSQSHASPEPCVTLAETQPTVEQQPALASLNRSRDRKIDLKCRSKIMKLLQKVFSKHRGLSQHHRKRLARGKQGIQTLAEVGRALLDWLPPALAKAFRENFGQFIRWKTGERLRHFIKFWGTVCMALDQSSETRATCVDIWRDLKNIRASQVVQPNFEYKTATVATAEAVIDAISEAGTTPPAKAASSTKPAVQFSVTPFPVNFKSKASQTTLNEKSELSGAPAPPLPSTTNVALSKARSRAQGIPTSKAPRIKKQMVFKFKSRPAVSGSLKCVRSKSDNENCPRG